MKRISIADVAKIAGVSVATVSNALNGKGRVGADTARKIQNLAEEVGYIPGTATQNMFHKNPHIGVFIRQYPREVMLPVRMGIEKAIRYYRQFEISFQIFYYDELPLETLFTEQARDLDGCIVIPDTEKSTNADVFRQYAMRFPLLFLQSDIGKDCSVPSVMVDAEMVGRIGAEYLSSIHRNEPVRAALIVGNKKSRMHQKIEAGFCAEASKRSIKLCESGESGDKMDGAYDTMEQILCRNIDLNSVFVTSYVSPAVCQCLQDLGRKDISVVGVDISSESRRYLEDGSLNMIIFQNQQMQGYTAIEMMAEFFHSRTPLSDRRIKPEIVICSNASLYR